jgi:hypothetical protein
LKPLKSAYDMTIILLHHHGSPSRLDLFLATYCEAFIQSAYDTTIVLLNHHGSLSRLDTSSWLHTLKPLYSRHIRHHNNLIPTLWVAITPWHSAPHKTWLSSGKHSATTLPHWTQSSRVTDSTIHWYSKNSLTKAGIL